MKHFMMIAALGCMMFGLAPAQTAAASECKVHYTRTACPGQEATSYKKCGGKQSCVKDKKASTMEECQARAVKSCRNRRLNITKSKAITATWQGKAIKSKSGNDDFCIDYAKRAEEFNRCDAK